MLSMPPATTTSALPAAIRSCASIAAFIPEPQTLLSVAHGTDSGSPAPKAACRAGACPSPAGSTQPITTSSTRSAATPACPSAPRIAAAPSDGALSLASPP